MFCSCGGIQKGKLLKKESFSSIELVDISLNKNNKSSLGVKICKEKNLGKGLNTIQNEFSDKKYHALKSHNMGLCYFYVGNLSLAKVFFQSAWEMSKKTMATSYYNLGLISLMGKDFNKAELIFKDLIKRRYSLNSKFLGTLGEYQIAQNFNEVRKVNLLKKELEKHSPKGFDLGQLLHHQFKSMQITAL